MEYQLEINRVVYLFNSNYDLDRATELLEEAGHDIIEFQKLLDDEEIYYTISGREYEQI